MKTIVLATGNNHKKEEYESIFENQTIQFKTLNEYGINLDVEENGLTFEDNAMIKAKYCKAKVNEYVIADDSGLIIDALPDLLNVHTARFMEGHPYQERCQKILDLMKEKSNRKARFVCCICLIDQNNQMTLFKGICEGSIAFQMSGSNGFGYDPIFIPEGYSCTCASLENHEKNQISHRGLASQKLKEFLLKEGE